MNDEDRYDDSYYCCFSLSEVDDFEDLETPATESELFVCEVNNSLSILCRSANEAAKGRKENVFELVSQQKYIDSSF